MPIYTIMSDYGGAYGWVKSPDSPVWAGVGGNIAGFGGWGGDLPISPELESDFIEWQGEFEAFDFSPTARNNDSRFNWPSFHDRGIGLAIRLKAEIGDAAIVVYEKPYEDPGRDLAERTEILAGGILKPLPSRRALAALGTAFTRTT